MAKFTKGPWTVHLAQTVSIRPVNSDTLIARCFGAYAKAEANARLIALTPELAEACIVALVLIEDGAVRTAADRLRAIVAKIEGKEVATNG
jgi:hypothetical protein